MISGFQNEQYDPDSYAYLLSLAQSAAGSDVYPFLLWISFHLKFLFYHDVLFFSNLPALCDLNVAFPIDVSGPTRSRATGGKETDRASSIRRSF